MMENGDAVVAVADADVALFTRVGDADIDIVLGAWVGDAGAAGGLVRSLLEGAGAGEILGARGVAAGRAPCDAGIGLGDRVAEIALLLGDRWDLPWPEMTVWLGGRTWPGAAGCCGDKKPVSWPWLCPETGIVVGIRTL